MADNLLGQYLLTRGFVEPTPETDEAILNDDARLAAIATLFNTYGDNALRDLLESAMQPIREELVMKASPYEVLPLREALAALASIVDLGTKYSQEHARREADRKGQQPDEETPPISDEPTSSMDNGAT